MVNRDSMRWNGSRRELAAMIVALTVVFSSSLGCKSIINRAQSPDQPIPVDETVATKTADALPTGPVYVGESCRLWGTGYAAIEGMSLATGLNGTGSSPAPSQQRDELVKELSSRREIPNARSLVAGTDSELILVRGMLPPGIRKGETFDLEIRTLRDTDGTSIESGTAIQCRLRPLTRVGRSIKKGQVKGLGKGNIIVETAFSTRDDESTKLRGIIPGGGIAVVDREMGLSLKSNLLPPKTTSQISHAINRRFTVFNREGREGASEPKTDKAITLRIPNEYRLNVGRYLLVVRNVAYNETVQQRVNRMEQLETQLNSPATAEVAALRLEAMGREGQPALKRALSHDDAEVRFHAAQALAYQDQADGVAILKLAARDEPAFRALALSALATLEASTATVALTELLHVPSAETRYGAFHALRAKPSQSSILDGEWIGDQFFLHSLESKTDPMLHFSRVKQAEIVVFDDRQTVSQDFLHVASGLTVKAVDSETIQITHFRSDGTDSKTTCSTRVNDLIRSLVDEGLGYGDLLKMFRNARQKGTLNSRLVVNAVPNSDREYLADEDSLELPPEKSDKYMAKATPTLFKSGNSAAGKQEAASPDDTASQTSAKTTAKTANSKPVRKDDSVRKASYWSKLLPLKKNDSKKRN